MQITQLKPNSKKTGRSKPVKTAKQETNQLNFITADQLSSLISTPVYTIRKLVREKKLPAYKITGKNYLFDYNEVLEVIKQCRV